MKEKGDQVSDLLYPKLTELPYYHYYHYYYHNVFKKDAITLPSHSKPPNG